MTGFRTAPMALMAPVIVLAVVAGPAPAATTNEHLAVQLSAADAQVRVNGFPVFAPGPGSVGQTFNVTGLVVDGTNRVDLELDTPFPFDPLGDPIDNPPPSLQVRVDRFNVVPGQYPPHHVASFADAGTVHLGAFDVAKQEATFVADGGEFAWEFTFPPGDIYDRIPFTLGINAVDLDPLPPLTVTFSKADGSDPVTYAGLAVDVGGAGGDLRAAVPSVGLDRLDDTGFARLRISHAGTRAATMSQIHLVRQVREEVTELSLNPVTTAITGATIDRGTVAAGSFDPGSERVVLEDDGAGVLTFAIDFDSIDAPDRVPGVVRYAAINRAATVDVSMITADGSKEVVFAGVPFPDEDLVAIDLLNRTPISGAEFIDDVGFTRLELRVSDGGEPLEIDFVTLRSLPRPTSQALSFTVAKDEVWAWQQGMPLADPLPAEDDAAIRDLVVALGAALDAGDLPTVDLLLETRALEWAEVRGEDPSLTIQEQSDFFANELFASAGWAMRPLDPADLVIEVLPNGQAVHVTHAARAFALESVEFTDQEGDPNSFGLDLFLTKLLDGQGGGTWVVFR